MQLNSSDLVGPPRCWWEHLITDSNYTFSGFRSPIRGNNDQFWFGEDGDLKEPHDDEDNEEQADDLGEPLEWHEPKEANRRAVMSRLFQKAVRRSDDETAAFAASKLVRFGGGFETYYWNTQSSPALRT